MTGLDGTRYPVRMLVPRRDGRYACGTVSGEFERRLAEQDSAAVAARIDFGVRCGRDYVRVIIAAGAADAPDLAGRCSAGPQAMRRMGHGRRPGSSPGPGGGYARAGSPAPAAGFIRGCLCML